MNEILKQYAIQKDPDPNRAVSQIDEVLGEHAELLSDLSKELVRARKCFDAVLFPEAPADASADVSPVRIGSPLAEAIAGQTRLVRTMLMDLRSINNRSTV